jgi:hypothetical protein
MADPIQLLSTKVEIQTTLGTPKVITGITKATEAVFSVTAHGFTAGKILIVDEVQGMSQINRRPIRVKAAPTADSFTAENLDSTTWSTYVGGGTVTDVTGFLSYETLTTFNFPEPQPNPEPITTIHDTEEREVFGLDSAPTATMDSHAQPLNAAIIETRKASLSKSDRVIKATFQNGNVMLINTKVAGGRGIDGAAGEVAKSQISLKFRAPEQWFAS